MSDHLINSGRQEEIEAAARQAGVPNPDFYDTSMIKGTAPENFWTLGVIITFCVLLAALFVMVGFVLHVF